MQQFEDYFLQAVNAAQQNICYFDADSAFYPGGRNGPYQDIESPLRNTSHWLVSFSVAYWLTGDNDLAVTAKKLAQFVLSNESYVLNERYVHRQKAGKDWCNGVIGQAWMAEGLLYAGKLLGRNECTRRAVQLLSDLPFDDFQGAWQKRDPRSGTGGIDTTFNHQSWLASVVSEADDPALRDLAVRFLDASLHGHFQADETGLIRHKFSRRKEASSIKSKIKGYVKRAISGSVSTSDNKSAPELHQRDLGYHLYDLYTLARLRLNIPSHELWNSVGLQRTLGCLTESFVISELRENPYAYQYNAPGFELPLISRAFRDHRPELVSLAETAFDVQVELTWDKDCKQFCANSYDPATLSSRVYELGLGIYYAKQ